MLAFKHSDDYPRARQAFEQASFNVPGISAAIDSPFHLFIPSRAIAPALRRTVEPTALNSLIRLFLLGVPVSLASAREALDTLALDTWTSAGLLDIDAAQETVTANIRMTTYDDLLLAVDRPRPLATTQPSDFVMSPGETTIQLAHATPAASITRALDIGTGCGALGLRLARHGARVIATDINCRAVQFAQFNGQLNGLASFDGRSGSLFTPVEGEQFELITSNPPFVLSPSRRLIFRDAEVRGDEFCRQLIAVAPAYLVEGGYCQLHANFAHRAGVDWRQELAEWFRDVPCDVLVWITNTQDISDYAMTWITSTESNEPAEVSRIYDQWMAYFEQQSIEAISYLLVTMRRRSTSRHWVRMDDTPREIVGPCGDEIVATFRRQDRSAIDDDPGSLLSTRLQLAPDVHIDQRHAMTADGLARVDAKLCKIGGSRFTMGVDPQVAMFVARCDGSTPAEQILRDLARAIGASHDFVTGPGLELVRSLVDRGILVIENR